MAHQLPYDIARCAGVQYDDGDWREDCERCLRRLAQGRPNGWQNSMPPNEVVVFECEYLIEAQNE